MGVRLFGMATFSFLLIFMVGVDVLAASTISGKISASKARYVKNTVVYLESVSGNHSRPKSRAKLDQKGHTFIPFVLPIVEGTTVDFLNNDNADHNVFSPDNEKYDLGTWPKGESREYTFKTPGAYAQLCKLHPSMLAYIVVLQNPFYAVCDKSGAYQIENVPPGDYTVMVWNERRKAAPVKVKVTADENATLDLQLVK